MFIKRMSNGTAGTVFDEVLTIRLVFRTLALDR